MTAKNKHSAITAGYPALNRRVVPLVDDALTDIFSHLHRILRGKYLKIRECDNLPVMASFHAAAGAEPSGKPAAEKTGALPGSRDMQHGTTNQRTNFRTFLGF